MSEPPRGGPAPAAAGLLGMIVTAVAFVLVRRVREQLVFYKNATKFDPTTRILQLAS
jgi:hypothetical protein